MGARAHGILILLALLLCAAPLHGQETDDDLRQRLQRLETELANLRSRVEERERQALDEDLRGRTLVQLYGDIGLRYHMLFEGQTETFNRPEYRLHIGAFGTAYAQDDQRVRYDLRMTTAALDINGKPVPTVRWLPLPGFGALPGVAFDRFLLDYELGRTLMVTAGRFPSPFTGTEMLFDTDYAFQGLSQSVRFDRFLPDAARRMIPRIQVVSTQSYMAENALGLPQAASDSQPIYIGGQFRLDLAPTEQPVIGPDGTVSQDINGWLELRFVGGLHWFDGEAEVMNRLGVGYLDRTTNNLDADGDLRSEFLVGEFYAEVMLLRNQRARVTAWFHGLWNFHAKPRRDGSSQRDDTAFDAGVSWGMERFEQRWDFKFAFHYFLIKPDAVMPEFNSEVLNTNIKGYELSLAVRIFPTVTAFGEFSISERENFDLPGFGRARKNDPNHARGQSTRIRIGLYLDF